MLPCVHLITMQQQKGYLPFPTRRAHFLPCYDAAAWMRIENIYLIFLQSVPVTNMEHGQEIEQMRIVMELERAYDRRIV